MRQRLYVVYDVKAQAPVGSVQLFSTDEQAGRIFGKLVESEGTMVHDFPDDFVMLCLGTLEFDSMFIESFVGALSKPIASGSAVVRALSRARSAEPVAESAS